MNPQQSAGIEHTPCPLCGSADFKPLFEATDLLHGKPGLFKVVRCRNCSHIFTSPRPKISTLSEYYPADYKPYSNLPVQEKASPFRKWLGDLFHRYMRSHDVIDILQSEGLKLLELGCASGTYLHSQRTYGLELFGVEFAEQPATFAREKLGLNVFHGTLEEAHFSDNFFNGVVGWMVVEHLPDPRTTFREIHRILKPGGTFAFSIPNAGSWEFLIFRRYWYALDVPRHLNHFSPRSIKRLLESEGFRITRIFHQVNSDYVPASLGYVVRQMMGDNRISSWLVRFPDNPSTIVRFLVRPLLQPIAWILSALHQSGRITVVAESTE